VYQLGLKHVRLTGSMMMSAGLPGKYICVYVSFVFFVCFSYGFIVL
jgi:hypothetical protein